MSIPCQYETVMLTAGKGRHLRRLVQVGGASILVLLGGERWTRNSAAKKKGFGSNLLINVPKSLGGEAVLEVNDSGLSYSLLIPIASIQCRTALVSTKKTLTHSGEACQPG